MAVALHLVPPRNASGNQELARQRLETISEMRAVLRRTLIVRHKQCRQSCALACDVIWGTETIGSQHLELLNTVVYNNYSKRVLGHFSVCTCSICAHD